MSKSKLEQKFLDAWGKYSPDDPAPIREYRAIPGRRFRFDFAWPQVNIAVEVQGGTWTGGRHVRGSGIASDCEKLNLAQMHGWKVFLLTVDMIRDQGQYWCNAIAASIQVRDSVWEPIDKKRAEEGL